MTKLRRKLIEVALPLEAINTASSREKSIRHGHPSTLHLWWARRPLAAARAVIFAQMVDDPSGYPEHFRTEEAQEKERQRLFRIIEDLVQWENTSNEAVINQARNEIWKSWRSTCADNKDHPQAQELFDPDKLPAFHDPFAGGGALPLEAQRLGLESYASDLNPVAVMINKAMIEIPFKFAEKPPVNPEIQKKKNLFNKKWHGAEGLAEDVRYYGQWIRDEGEKRLGSLYPRIEITVEMATSRPDLKSLIGKNMKVIAWIWARTVKSPNPAFANVAVPLASTFMLSTKPGKEAYIEPVIVNDGYRFEVRVGKPKDFETSKNGTKIAKATFACIVSGTPISGDYIKSEGVAGRMSTRLMAIVAEGDRGRIYLPPTAEHEVAALKAEPKWKPEIEFFQQALGFRVGNYGMTKWSDLFIPRQLVALTNFSDLVLEARNQVKRDALAAGLSNDARPLVLTGTGADAYADALAVYLAFAVDKIADRNSTGCAWASLREHARNTFGRQALPIVWDFAESNPLSDSSGNFEGGVTSIVNALSGVNTNTAGFGSQAAAQNQDITEGKIVSTDPPYYDNIGYADLSDFFYVWLRRSLREIFPDLFATLSVPKDDELVATPGRHGGKGKAETFFLEGMTEAMHRLAEQVHPAFPITIYYAFKQSEGDAKDGTSSTGWETFLDAAIRAGFVVTGTWPIRTELDRRIRGMDSNALASSIILSCRRRPLDAPSATLREFVTALKTELPTAINHLQRGNIAPVDLAQAAIGPGMAVYSRYCQVVDASGRPLLVRQALVLINETLDEVLVEQEGDFDSDSRWALAWFEQSGFLEGEYGVAETLSKAKNTSVAGLADANILKSKGGKVRLLRPEELPKNWDPERDARRNEWETVHHLIKAMNEGGEGEAARLVAKLGNKADIARELSYRLYVICERKKRAQEALAYNGLVQSWPEIVRLAREGGAPQRKQSGLFEESEE